MRHIFPPTHRSHSFHGIQINPPKKKVCENFYLFKTNGKFVIRRSTAWAEGTTNPADGVGTKWVQGKETPRVKNYASIWIKEILLPFEASSFMIHCRGGLHGSPKWTLYLFSPAKLTQIVNVVEETFRQLRYAKTIYNKFPEHTRNSSSLSFTRAFQL